MDDTRAWWDDFEVVEGLGSPLEELEALSVSGELKSLVLLSGIGSSGSVDLNGVINDQIDWAKWVDLGWIATETSHSVTHGSQIDDSWDTTNKIKSRLIIKYRGWIGID